MNEQDIPPFATGIFRAGGGSLNGPVLLGGLCSGCRRQFFPRPAICPDCLGAVEEVELGSRGRVYSFTVVRTKPPLGLPQPYAVGYVDLNDCKLRIFTLLDPANVERFRIGAPVRLAACPLGDDGHGNPRLRPYFTLLDP